jgi:hypothetical protein
MYDIDEEIEQLKEVKDIQDELHILSVLLDNQKTVLKQATKALRKHTEDRDRPFSRSPTVSPTNFDKEKEKEKEKERPDSRDGDIEGYSSTNNFNKLYGMVEEQENRRRSLEIQAEQANNAVCPQ